jgi:hypothetical protein
LTTANGNASSWRSQVGGGRKSVALGRFFLPLLVVVVVVVVVADEAKGHHHRRRRGIGTHCCTLSRNCRGLKMDSGAVVIQ